METWFGAFGVISGCVDTQENVAGKSQTSFATLLDEDSTTELELALELETTDDAAKLATEEDFDITGAEAVAPFPPPEPPHESRGNPTQMEIKVTAIERRVF
jgi:hypothetical protein